MNGIFYPYVLTVTFGPSAHGDTPPPLGHAEVLNGWSLMILLFKHLNWLISSESFSVLPHATFLFITHKSSPPPALKNCLLSVCNHLSKAEKKG